MQHSTASNLVPEEGEAISADNFTHDHLTDIQIVFKDELASVKSESPTPSPSADGAFFTAPQTPTESVDYSFKSGNIFPSSSGSYEFPGIYNGKSTLYSCVNALVPNKLHTKQAGLWHT